MIQENFLFFSFCLFVHFHGLVVGNALSRNPKPGQVVARVNILASEGLVFFIKTLEVIVHIFCLLNLF